MRRILGFFEKIIRWFIVLLFVLMMTLGGVSTVLFGLAALMVAPIGKIKILKEKLKISRKLNVVLVIALFFAGTILSPKTEPETITPEVSNATVEDVKEEIIEQEIAEKETEVIVAQVDENISEELSILEDKLIPEDSTFTIRFLDVGQGDATLIECDGHYMLIDGGNKDASSKIYSVLEESEITHLDMIIGTHADEDHIGGLAGALNFATADLIFCTTNEYDTEAFKDFLKYAEQNGGGIKIPEIGDSYPLGSANVTILGINAGVETNDSSIVLKIEYGDTSYMFVGDAEILAEQAVIENTEDISAMVLKVGHHGSSDSTSDEFLNKVMPDYAIISVGADNSYLHPNDDTLNKLEDAGIEIYRTDLQGEITLTSDSKKVSIVTEKSASKEDIMVSGEEAAAKAQAEAEAKAKAEAEKKVTYTYKSLNKTMYATQSVNVRSIPSTEGNKLGGLSYAEEITVTGQCNETGWYRINYKGQEVYVSNKYLADEKPIQNNVVQQEPSSKNNDGSVGVTAPAGTDYVLNTNTRKFHYPSCKSVKQMKAKNTAYYNGTREEVIAKGYDPCGNCHP